MQNLTCSSGGSSAYKVLLGSSKMLAAKALAATGVLIR